MSEDGDKDTSWRLFTSEDMIDGYKALKRRKKTARNVKKVCGLSVNNSEAPNSSRLSSTSLTSERLKSKSCKNKMSQERPLRTPFTDITNKLPRSKSKTNEDRDKAKAKYCTRGNAELKDWSRNLFEDEFSKKQTASAIVYDENCGMTFCSCFSYPDFAKRALSNNEEKKVSIMKKVTVAELKALGKTAVEAFFMLHVKFKSIDESMGWSYHACTSCEKETRNENPCPICESCNRYVSYPDRKFKMHFVAEDTTGQMQVVLVDREVRTLIGRRALDSAAEMKAGSTIPEAFFSTLNKEYSVVIQMREFNIVNNFHVYWATNICKGLLAF
ncbi:uncharacterized protein LOC108222125 [Daucus carota subsp. sativus]|uniref:uncharacterized protein LOC108222125 n=1 Tax=Daucus carota subsp. sativus TaxID=79200 RepID=UPI0007EF875F|nr:PREDICTED: uncharacterized protein LOC108222125 [Daucus carota subsp. sativus]